MKTDKDKTLLLLQQSGEAGIHSFELGKIVGTIRIAARIEELRKQGHNILSVAERMGDAIGVRYYLVTDSKPELQEEKQPRRFRYEFVGNMAVKVAVN